MEIFIIIITSILMGSIPTAYLLVKKFYGIDITSNGTGNVGAMNSARVTSSSIIGIAVFLLDFAKGLAAVYIASLILPDSFYAGAVALIVSVTSHCFNPWLKFKGGRGLATAAGGALMFSPLLLVLWVILWVIAYLFRKNIHFGNIAATVLSLALVWSSGDIINKYTYPSAEHVLLFKIAGSILFLIILIKHWEPIKSIFGKEGIKIKKD
ncbi:MAG: glycerol-3-phosphate acyltransferase [Ignavibacteria bacterium]|nr:MAG: glycerol-3-phosphate acyltransferase [Ignavibacteria bacterium]